MTLWCRANLLVCFYMHCICFSDHVHTKMVKSENASISFCFGFPSTMREILHPETELHENPSEMFRIDECVILHWLGKLSFGKRMIYCVEVKLGRQLSVAGALKSCWSCVTNSAMIGRDETILKFHIMNKMITVISIFLVLLKCSKKFWHTNWNEFSYFEILKATNKISSIMHFLFA